MPGMSDKVIQDLTARFIAALQQAKEDPSLRLPWQPAWDTSGTFGVMPMNPHTGKEYRGSNIFWLWMQGYPDPRWLGFNQAKEMLGYKRIGKRWVWKGEGEDPGYGVRKGEKGTKILRPRMVKDKETGDPKMIGYAVATVFNAMQIDGMPGPDDLDIPEVNPEDGYEQAARIADAWGVRVTHGGGRAFYAPGPDLINMPEAGRFTTLDRYWSTRLHEMVHSTGHESRLNRLGSHSYAEEELVAEMGSAFLCAHLGIRDEGLQDSHERYILGWISRLKDDPKFILKAGQMAYKAADLILESD